MALNIQKTNDLKQPHWHGLLYGPPKTGKTTFCATLPKPLILSMDEEGMQSLRNQDLAFIEILDWITLQDLVNKVERSCKDGKFTIEGQEFESLIFDPLNMMQTLLHKTYTVNGKSLTLPDRGAANDKLTNVVRRICRFQCHTLFTCLERLDKDELTGRVKAGLDLSPAIMRSFPAIVSFVWHTVVENKGGGKVAYKIATATEGYYEAGGRYAGQVVPPRVESDFGKLYEYVTRGQND